MNFDNTLSTLTSTLRVFSLVVQDGTRQKGLRTEQFIVMNIPNYGLREK